MDGRLGQRLTLRMGKDRGDWESKKKGTGKRGEYSEVSPLKKINKFLPLSFDYDRAYFSA
jgi:hypothetical protein